MYIDILFNLIKLIKDIYLIIDFNYICLYKIDIGYWWLIAFYIIYYKIILNNFSIN